MSSHFVAAECAHPEEMLPLCVFSRPRFVTSNLPVASAVVSVYEKTLSAFVLHVRQCVASARMRQLGDCGTARRRTNSVARSGRSAGLLVGRNV